MKTITKEFEYTASYDLSRLGDPERLLFFDIETTGLSAKRDMVYLIGCVYLKDNVWHMKQWFADSISAEAELLVHFFLFASRFSLLVHFNGTTFDLPFLKERADKLQTPLPSQFPKSFDLYRELKPLKKLLGLADCRQKTLETFLGTRREDPYNGGQLIHFYWKYLRTGELSLYDALLLHNEEDVEGLPSLLSLLSYRDFFRSSFHLESEQKNSSCKDGQISQKLFISCHSDSCTLPAPCRFFAGGCLICCQENTLTLEIPLLEGSLKYFFHDYANYYYLPEEDQAIHKSVASFVDPSHRKKATAKTCYQKRTGLFFPVPESLAGSRPLFYPEYKKNPPYLEYTPGLFADSFFLNQFLLATLSK